VPRSFGGYWDWIDTVEPLLRSVAIADPSFLWWDVRLQPQLGTVEVRVMDGQTSVDDVAALAALVQSLASLELARPDAPGEELRTVELIEENRFLAARDGIDALLIEGGERVPATDQLERVLAACAQHAEQLDCEHELGGLRRLAASTGAARQLEHGGDLRQVTEGLAEAYCPEVIAMA
jgi:carboxylate-amine ligase